LEDGKSYSVYLSGFYNTATKQVEGFVIEDAVPAAIDYNVALVRFVNASPNAQSMQLSVLSSTAPEHIACASTRAAGRISAFASVRTV
jgi:hypothetical protein